MKPLYCWRCKAVVPMMDGGEFAQVEERYRAAVRGIKSRRARRSISLQDARPDELYRPVQLLYRRLAKRAGLDPVVVSPGHVLKHRLASYGPACRRCGLPLRTPSAKICAGCGTVRVA